MVKFNINSETRETRLCVETNHPLLLRAFLMGPLIDDFYIKAYIVDSDFVVDCFRCDLPWNAQFKVQMECCSEEKWRCRTQYVGCRGPVVPHVAKIELIPVVKVQQDSMEEDDNEYFTVGPIVKGRKKNDLFKYK